MKTSKFFFSTLIAASAMTATAYAEDTILTYDNLFSSEDGWSFTSLRDRSNFGLDTSEQTLSLTNSNWGQSYATYTLDSKITATEATALTFSVDITKQDGNGMYSFALIGTAQTFVVGFAYGSNNISYAATTDSSHAAYGFGSNWDDGGTSYQSLSATETGLSVSVGESCTVSGTVSYINNSYSLSLTAGESEFTYDLGETFNISSLAFAGDGPNSTQNVTFSNLSLSGAEYLIPSLVWDGGESGAWGDSSWSDGTTGGQTFSKDADVTFNSSVTMTATDAVSLSSLTVAADKTLTLAGVGTVSSLSLNNSGTISINSESTLNTTSVTALGTITGSGKIAFATGDVTPGTNFTAETWTGTVAFNDVSKDGLKVADFGNANSTVEFNNFTGYFAEGNNGTISSDISIVNGLTINNGWSGGTLTFSGNVSGDSFSYTKSNSSQKIKFSNTVALETATLLGATANFAGTKAEIGTLNLGSATIEVAETTDATVENLYFGGASGADTTKILGSLTVTGNVAQTSSGQTDNEVLALGEDANLTIEGTFGTTATNASDLSQVSYKVNIGNGASLSAATIAQANDLDVSLGENASMSADALTLNAVWGNKTHTFTGADTETSVVSVKGISLTNANSNLSVSSAKVLVGESGISGAGSMTLSDTILGVQDSATSWSSSVSMSLSETTTADVDSGKSISLEGVLSGTGKLIKTGEGTLTLSGDNTYTGGTTVSTGTLVAGSNSALGTNSVKISGGKLEVASGVTVSNAIEIVLNSAYTAEAAIQGTGTLASSAITVSGDLDALITLQRTVAQQYEYQLLSSSLTTDGVTVTLSSELQTAIENKGWTYTLADNGSTLTLTIPEPSAFGLLAGVGALALVASRRRRSRR